MTENSTAADRPEERRMNRRRFAKGLGLTALGTAAGGTLLRPEQAEAEGTLTTKEVEEHLPSSVVDVNAILHEPTVYVSKLGNDSNSGVAWEQAFLTIHKALEHLRTLTSKTGTIYVGTGVFTEKPLVRPSRCSIIGQGPFLTEIVQEAGGNSNTLADAAWGIPGEVGEGGLIADLTINGNKENQTIAEAETVATERVTLPTSGSVKLNVLNAPTLGFSTKNFPPNGYLWVGAILCKYTSKTAESFGGVQAVYYESETANEVLVLPFASVGHGLAIQSRSVTTRNVVCTYCAGSARIIQGSGTNSSGQFPYQCKFENSEDNESERYGLEILMASDGLVSNWIGADNVKGGIFAGGVNWRWNVGHVIGFNGFEAALSPQLVRICAHKQQFDNYFLDNAPYTALVIDSAAHNQILDNIRFQGELLSASSASAGAGAGVQLYGSAPVTKLRLELLATSRVSSALSPRPTSYLVGAQNLAAPSGGKVQVLSALTFSPTSAVGGVVTVAGSGTFSYTGSTTFGANTLEPVSAGATSIKLNPAGARTLTEMGLASSGTITIFPASNSEAGVAALRVKYTGVSGDTITGIPSSGAGSIPEALPANTGVAQHFLTGVTGGTGGSVPDNTELKQMGRGPYELSGTAQIMTSGNLAPAPLAAGIRTTGLINGKPNPFFGAVKIAVGATEGVLAHGLEVVPGFYEATPRGDPQQRWWVTATNIALTVHVAAPIETAAVQFNVIARATMS
jgi:hypothetical protein